MMVGTGIQKVDYDRLRREARAGHKKIQLDSYFGKWRKSDATKTLMIERVIGVAVLPVVGLWSFLLFMITLGMALASLLLKAFGSILWRTKG